MKSPQATETRTPENKTAFEPKIVAFLCTWCSYTGADTAGIARLNSPANIRAIRVPCSGRVAPELIMRSFDQGADGVLVLGCHIGECHYDSGNHRTAKRLPALQGLMAFTGLEPDRLRLDWVSASEGERFARISNEFTETVRALGPARWRLERNDWAAVRRLAEYETLAPQATPTPPSPPTISAPEQYLEATQALRAKAHQLLTSGEVRCVIGYETGTRGRTRPAFIYHPKDAERLVWNPECTHNLATYLGETLAKGNGHSDKAPTKKVAIVAKSCDSRAINVLIGEGRFQRDQVYVIGVVCDGIHERKMFPDGSGPVTPLDVEDQARLQSRCLACDEPTPLVYDTLIGEPSKKQARTFQTPDPAMAQLESLTSAQRMEFWLEQFDRCIRCYACRQACPMCDCPTCLYERDDSLWAGVGIGLNEKRAFHLGRAYHLAGRCIGCNECERACPMDIPISLLNLHLAQEVERAFGYRAGLTPTPSPFLTILGREEA